MYFNFSCIRAVWTFDIFHLFLKNKRNCFYVFQKGFGFLREATSSEESEPKLFLKSQSLAKQAHSNDLVVVAKKWWRPLSSQWFFSWHAYVAQLFHFPARVLLTVPQMSWLPMLRFNLFCALEVSSQY
jgi:hypothetical protein